MYECKLFHRKRTERKLEQKDHALCIESGRKNIAAAHLCRGS